VLTTKFTKTTKKNSTAGRRQTARLSKKTKTNGTPQKRQTAKISKATNENPPGYCRGAGG
jgi:hypothetical protein